MKDIKIKCYFCERFLDVSDDTINEVICHCNEPTHPLLYAINTGDKELLIELLNRGADINYRHHMKGPDFNNPTRNMTPLMIAAMNNCNVIELLLDKGADINARDSKGCTPLFYAVKKEPMEILIKRRADINVRDSEGRNPLFFSKVEAMEVLLNKGIDINARDNQGVTALNFLAFLGDEKAVEFLLSKGADPNIKDNGGNTPLDAATYKERKECIKLLSGLVTKKTTGQPASKKICNKCGKENIDTSKFCKSCGNPLQISASKEWDLIAGKVAFEPDLIMKYSDIPTVLKTISSAKICIRCGEIYPLEACSNCGSNNFKPGFTTEGVVGIFCFKCNIGYSSWTCPKCKTLNPINNSFAMEKKKKVCFIATASCGTENHPDVVILRYYRDTILSQSKFGQYFIKLYYIVSPPIANLISKSGILRKIFRKGLIYPIANLCRNLLSRTLKN